MTATIHTLETGCHLSTRLKQHQEAVKKGQTEKSAVAEHIWSNQHSIDWKRRDPGPRFYHVNKKNQRGTTYPQTLQSYEQRWRHRGITHLGLSSEL